MSGLGAALAGLVGGYQQGRNTRNSWDDRKTENARKKRRDEIFDAQEKRAQEAHDINMGASQRQQKAWDQAWDDQGRLRSAAEEADRAANAGMETPPAPLGAYNPGAVTAQSLPVQSGQDSMVLGALPPQSGSSISTKSPPPPTGPVRAETAPTQSQWGSLGQALPGATMEQVSAGGIAGAVTGMPRGATRDGYVNDHGQQIVGGVAVPPAQALNHDGTSIKHPEQGERRTLTQDTGTVRDTALGAISRMTEQVGNQGVDFANTLAAPSRWFRGYVFGDEPDSPGQKPIARADLNRDGITETVVSPAIDALRPAAETSEEAAAALSKEAGRKVTPAEVEIAQGAVEVMDQIGDDPAMKAAADALPVEALGAKRGQVLSPQRRAKAADIYLENYRKDGAPIYMRELMRQGKFEEAERFDGFIRSQEAQAGMRKWGEGMFAALTGDADGVFDFLTDAYNEPGYYDDGYQVVKPESELLRDQGGNPVGLKLTLQHSATGEKVTQTGQLSDIMNQFLWKLSPQEAFKAHNENQAALKKALIEAEAKRDERAAALIRDQLGWDNRAGLEMMKGSAGLDGKMTMSWPEAQAAAMGASPIDGLDDVEVAYRPQ